MRVRDWPLLCVQICMRIWENNCEWFSRVDGFGRIDFFRGIKDVKSN